MRAVLLSGLATCLVLFGTASHAEPEQAGGDNVAAPYERPQQRVQVAPGRYIHMMCMGNGSPTVVLSAGADGWSADWRLVQPALAKRTKVCTWDRAGHGYSSGSSEPQDISHREVDLERALAGAGLTGPYVMVAHSLGGLETMRFTDLHRDRVAGIVLVDPSFPGQWYEFHRVAPALMVYSDRSDKPYFDMIRRCLSIEKRTGQNTSSDCTKPFGGYPEPLRTNLLAASRDPLYWQAFLSMFQSETRDSRAMIDSKRAYGSLPLIVLDAGILAFPDAPSNVQREVVAAKAAKARAHQAMARLSTRGISVSVPDSGHPIQMEKPAIVIDAVNKVIDETQLSR